MGITQVVGSIAIVPGALAFLLRNVVPSTVTCVLAHISITGFAVAVAAHPALCARSTWLLGKGKDGQVSLLGYALWYPYHLGLHVRLAYRRRTRNEPLYHQILPGWYLGGWPYAAKSLPAESALSVVDVTCELPRTHKHAYLCLPTWDTLAPTPEQIQAGVTFALEQRRAGRNVYVHCAHGHGRSATVLAACLLASGAAGSVDAAVATMKSARHKVRLNKPQTAALAGWWAKYGKDGKQCAVADDTTDAQGYVLVDDPSSKSE